MPIYINNGTTQPLESFRFPGGEVHVRAPVGVDCWRVTAVLNNSEAIMELVVAVDALKRHNRLRPSDAQLVIPYVPYARQDRVTGSGEPHSLKAFAGIINMLGFGEVVVWDQHSTVTEGVIDNCRNVPLDALVRNLPYLDDVARSRLVVVAPDAGALKRAEAFAKRFCISRVVTANKVRDPATGNIEGLTFGVSLMPFHPDHTHFLIVDDICDGGRTFIEVAKEIKRVLRGKPPIDLLVTHGIFSKGIDALDGSIDTVFCTNSRRLHAEKPLDAILKFHPGTVSKGNNSAS